MKICKLICLFVLMLCVCCASAAFAASGDITAQLENENSYKMAEINGSIYFCGDSSEEINVLNITTGEIDSVNVEGLDDYIGDEEKDADNGVSDSVSLQYQALASDADHAYLLFSVSTSASTEDSFNTTAVFYVASCTADGQTLTCSDIKALLSDALVETYNDESSISSYPRTILGAACQDHYLEIASYNDNYDAALYILDMDTMTVSETEDAGSLIAYTPYRDQQVLIARYDSTWSNVEYVLYDLSSGSASMISSVSTGEEYSIVPYAPAYDASSDTLYIAQDSALCAVKDLDVEHPTTICALPIGVTGMNGLLLQDGRYAVSAQSCLVIRSTSTDGRTAGKLTIATTNTWLENVTSSYYSFMNTHGELEVYLSSDVTNVLEGMMNQDSDVDVYILSSTDEAFDSVYTRGYMAAIQSDKLSMDDMYDFIKNFCYQNGELVCYPVYSYGSCVGINTTALEKIGMTLSDMPTSWPEFLAKLPEIAEKLEAVEGYSVFGSYQTQESLRYTMISTILSQYYNEQVNMGTTDTGYSTPELIAALQAVMNVDFESLGVTMTQEDEDSGMIDMDAESSEAVLDFYFDYLPEGWYTAGEEPLLLTVNANASPALTQNVSFAFINPFSKNYQAAVEYIEALADAASVAPQYLYAFTPKNNEPQRYDWYEENIANYQTYIDEYTSYMNSAESNEEKAFYQDIVTEWQGYLDDAIENDWMIKPLAISSYQALADKVSVERFNPLYSSSDTGSEIYELVSQLTLGTLSPSDFVSQVDRKVQMMILEGN